MKIVGFNLNKVSIDKKEEPKAKLEIKYNIHIDDIQKEEVKASEKNYLRFSFTFSIDYLPNIANIEMKGTIVTVDVADESKEILKDWKKKKFEGAAKVGLFNLIMHKCNLKALQLEDEMNLPLHVPLPKLGMQKPQEYNKETSKEKDSNKPKYAG